MTKVSFINPKEIATPMGYTHVVSIESPRKILYISGQISKDQTGQIVGEGDLEAQTRQVYSNILAILRSQGASFKDVVKLNTYSTQPEKIALTRKVRTEFITGENPPASTFVGVTTLADPAFLVEIEAIAILE